MSNPSSPGQGPDAAQPAPFARFWRCALQVNPFSYSEAYRGQDHGLDEDAYNQALAAKCVELDIRVVGVADHGSVDAVDKLRDALTPHGILVFPGFEIASTEKVHLVCLFPEDTTKDQLNRYLGKLHLTDVDEHVRPSDLGYIDLAKCIQELGGFSYAAHITGTNGLLRLGNKDGGGLTHVWRNCQHVRVAQIPGAVADLDDKFRKVLENRDPNYSRERPIALIHAKDIASPEQLELPEATCWVKMTRPSFEAFKIAFLDPDSRVRLSLDEQPHSVLESLRINGGYLDGVQAYFSDHLNALIGGRGAGKSTLIECLRYVLELPPKGKQALKLHHDIIKENLGKQSGSLELTMRSATQHGARFTISRRHGEPPIVRDESGAVSQQTPRDLLPQVEIYGQNEIFELAQDEASQRRLLEQVLPIASGGTERRASIQKKLNDNAQKLAKARTDLDELTGTVARLPRLGEQLKGFHALGIAAKLAKTPLYARERQLMTRVQQELNRAQESVESLADSLPDLTFLSDKALEGLPDAGLLRALRAELEQLRNRLLDHHQALRETTAQGKAALAPHQAAWAAALKTGEQELEGALAGLPDLAGKNGREVGVAYRQLIQEIERIKPLEAKQATFTQLIASLEQERKGILAELSDLQSARANTQRDAVRKLNERLKGKLRIEIRTEGNHRALLDFLAACKLEGVGEKRLAWIEENEVKPLALARAIREGTQQLAELGATPLAAEALSKLPHATLLELEAIELSDSVSIELNVAHGDQEQYRKLEQLSTGQQCTAVLHLLLLVNLDPLVIDQPEDNLDNAFIAERIVRELRDAKTRRQFLFSTHNANIPVFGDAEWIGVLTASDQGGKLEADHQGSIDVPYIREQAAEILEGGKAAFTQRKEMYEF